MISLALLTLTVCIVGFAVKELLYRRTETNRVEAMALVLGFGLGFTPLLMFYWAFTGARLHPGNLLLLPVPFAVVAVALGWRRWRRGGRLNVVAWPRLSGLEWGLVTLIGCSVVFVTLLMLSKPLDIWDAVTSWGYKTKVLYYEQTIYTDSFFCPPDKPARVRLHPTYPLGVPLLQSLVASFIGAFDETKVKFVSVLFYVLLMLSMYGLSRRWLTRTQSLLACAVLLSIPFIYYQTIFRILLIGGKKSNLLGGMADLPLACFVFLSTMALFRWFESAAPVHLISAAVFSAMAGFMKEEGLAIAVVLSGTVLLFAMMHRRDRPLIHTSFFFAPWLVLMAPWLYFRSTLPPDAHLERWEGELFDVLRLMQQLPESLGFFLREASHLLHWGMMWVLFLVLSLLGLRQTKTTDVKYLYLIILGSLACDCLVVALVPVTDLERTYYESRAVGRFFFHVAPVAVFLMFHLYEQHTKTRMT
jgi:hypothetical protein